MSGVNVMRMKDVIISVTGVQQGVNGPDAMELVTAGQYGQDEKETLLTWQESELTGMEGTKTSLRVQPRGVVLSRERIENNLWNYDYEGGTNVVDVYVGYLRKKIDAGFSKKLIHTVWGTGWVLRED